MNVQNPDRYFQAKLELMQKLVRLCEDFISNFDEIQDPNIIVTQRQTVIDGLLELDEQFGPDAMASCTPEQLGRLQGAVNLVLALDAQCIKLLEDAKVAILSDIKNNHTEQKVAQYTPATSSQRGKFLDYKK